MILRRGSKSLLYNEFFIFLAMSESEIKTLIEYPNEERHLEFKRSKAWDGDFKAKTTKSIMALANLRDGGWIVIGKEERSDRTFETVGMTPDDYDSFDPDNIKAFVYGYAKPPVSFQVLKNEYQGKKFILIKVEEFDELPIICQKDCGEILYAGEIYVRSKGKPETIHIPTEAEMREIIENTIDKGVRKFVQRLQRTGLWVSSTPFSASDDEDDYRRQRADLI